MTQQSIHDRIMSREAPPRIAPGTPLDRRPGEAPLPLKQRVAVGLGVLLLLAVAGGAAALRCIDLPTLLATPAVATKGPAATSLDTPFLAHANQAGRAARSNVYPVFGSLLTDGADYNVVSTWNEQEPGRHAIQALVGLDYHSPSSTGSAGGVVVASPNGAACEGAMIRLAPLSAACPNVPATLPQGSTLTNTLGKVQVYALDGNGGQAMLVPSGGGCVVVSIAWARG